MRLGSEADVHELGLAADARRKALHPDGVVTYIVDRNINYTNVCTTACRFCAFYRPVGHAEGYVLTREQLGQKIEETVAAGGIQILLQGGLNPALHLEWYEDLFRWMKADASRSSCTRSARRRSGTSCGSRTSSVEEVLRAAARGRHGLAAGRRRRGAHRSRAQQDRQGQVHERRVARGDARRAPLGMRPRRR